MIWGIGTDIVECARIARFMENYEEKVSDRIFTAREEAYCRSHKKGWVERFAGRFAAKEAVFKAFGTGYRKGMSFADIEIINEADGRPVVKLHQQALSFAQSSGIGEILISISHCKAYATATAIAMRAGNNQEEK